MLLAGMRLCANCRSTAIAHRPSTCPPGPPIARIHHFSVEYFGLNERVQKLSMSRTTPQSPPQRDPPCLNRATLLKAAAALWQENVMFRVIAWPLPRENGVNRPVIQNLKTCPLSRMFGPVRRNVVQLLDGSDDMSRDGTRKSHVGPQFFQIIATMCRAQSLRGEYPCVVVLFSPV